MGRENLPAVGMMMVLRLGLVIALFLMIKDLASLHNGL